MTKSVENIIARQLQKVREGQYYEAHQQLRVIATRYVKHGNLDSATEILASGARMLFDENQPGSGHDLCMYLLEIFLKNSLNSTLPRKAILLSLLRCYPDKFPTKKRFVDSLIQWSSKCSDYPTGDPEIHHVAGTIFAQDGDFYLAEKHFILGTPSSPDHLASLEYEWYTTNPNHNVAAFASRCLLPYLIIGNLSAARKSYHQFLLLYSQSSPPSPPPKSLKVEGKTISSTIFPDAPLLNFLSLLLSTVERGDSTLFNRLESHYSRQFSPHIPWSDALERIGNRYFALPIKSQANPLLDLMGGLFGNSSPPPDPHALAADAFDELSRSPDVD